MKTITQYRPLIFGLLMERTREREINRRALLMNLLIALGYGLVGFGLMIDLGVAPWNWEFWLVFGPVIANFEILIHCFPTNLWRSLEAEEHNGL